MSSEMTTEEARDLLGSWVIAAEASRRSAGTIKVYVTGVRQYLDWCDARGIPPRMDEPAQARGWLAELAGLQRSANTMNIRLQALRTFSLWLVAEEELGAAGAARVDWAALDETIPDAITVDQRDALLAVCHADKSFYGIRDEAMFSLMFDALVRSDETVSMVRDGDINLREKTARVRRGKGGKERFTAFGAMTARRLDRYERKRRLQLYSDIPEYWVGKRGPLTYAGLYAAFKHRCRQAGIEAHPHMLRAGGAVNWRRKGGTTESLMTVAGWRDPKMAMHYTRVAEIEIALAEARRIHES